MQSPRLAEIEVIDLTGPEVVIHLTKKSSAPKQMQQDLLFAAASLLPSDEQTKKPSLYKQMRHIVATAKEEALWFNTSVAPRPLTRSQKQHCKKMKHITTVVLSFIVLATLAHYSHALESPCAYCKYCQFCKDCRDCPCVTSAAKPFCGYCKYCKLCTACSICDSLCAEGSWGASISDAIGNFGSRLQNMFSGADDVMEDRPDINELDAKIKRHKNKDEL